MIQHYIQPHSCSPEILWVSISSIPIEGTISKSNLEKKFLAIIVANAHSIDEYLTIAYRLGIYTAKLESKKMYRLYVNKTLHIRIKVGECIVLGTKDVPYKSYNWIDRIHVIPHNTESSAILMLMRDQSTRFFLNRIISVAYTQGYKNQRRL